MNETPGPRRLPELLRADHPLTWVMTGDSITHGIVHTHGGRSYAEHVHEAVRADLGRTRDAFIKTAVSGGVLAGVLEDFDHGVRQWRPDVVTLMIGTNDCSTSRKSAIDTAAFEQSLVTFLTQVREGGAVPLLLTPPPVDTVRAPERSRTSQFAAVVASAATRSGTALVDVFSEFTSVARAGFPRALMNDAYHPNARGHAVIATRLAHTLGIDAGSPYLSQLHALIAGPSPGPADGGRA